MIVCIMGTLVEISVSHEFDSTSRFSRLSVKGAEICTAMGHNHIRLVMFMHHVQQPQILHLAKVRPLNMETCEALNQKLGEEISN